MSFDNFDRDFDRKFSNFFKFGLAAWVLFVLVDLAILAGIVYVVLHFLAKVW